ncbi:MAG: ArnT family glycosyltransferase [Hyphomonadaceae bacterium]
MLRLEKRRGAGYSRAMTSATISPPSAWLGWRTALLFAVGLALLRVALLTLTPLNLHGDEAQYWSWSRTLDWGYFSKPPLIAWVIRATTSVFGNAEWAVRLAAPFAHAATALLLYALARRLYGPTAGAWALLGWALMPGVWLSSAVISTDALLLTCWSGALLCAWRLIETRSFRWAIALGVACGLGLLAKYAMAYFCLGAGAAALLSAPARAAFLSWRGAAALAAAAAILAPNLIWNATHDFATIAHTAANADLKTGPSFNLEELFDFLVGQLGVLGPLQFAAFAFLLTAAARAPQKLGDADRFLLSFALPALIIISAQALISRAHANWAAAAYPAACVWIAGRFAQGRGRALLIASTALHGAAGLVFIAAALAPGFADAIGLANGFKRARGWPETAQEIAHRAQTAPYSAIMLDSRLYYYGLRYYWRDAPPPTPLRVWRVMTAPSNQAETEASLRAGEDTRVLAVVTHEDQTWRVRADFRSFTPLARVDIPLGGGKFRRLDFYDARGYAPNPKRGAALRQDDVE